MKVGQRAGKGKVAQEKHTRGQRSGMIKERRGGETSPTETQG